MSTIEDYIYLDHAAGTPVSEDVMAAMEPYFSKVYANPSGLCSVARNAQKALEDARSRIGNLLGVTENEIIFTSGGTESCNLAILGTAYANKDKGNHIITSAIEHHAVLNTCAYLETIGFNVTYIQPDKNGVINPENVVDAMTDNTILVTIMYANNEIGTIQPVDSIVEHVKAKNKNVYIHSDACQAPAYLPIHSSELQVDLLTINASKIYGPKGAALLVKKRNVLMQSIMFGGVQEDGYRPGTENVPAALGLAAALQETLERKPEESERMRSLQHYFYESLSTNLPNIHVNARESETLPGHVHISIPGYESEAILYELDKRFICASSGSACSSRSLDPSHVLKAIQMTEEMAHGALRFTMGRSTTQEHIDKTIHGLKASIDVLS